MNNKFDELTKSLAQSITRRGALKKFGLGLAGIALAGFGLVNNAEADGKNSLPTGSPCHANNQCRSGICDNGYCACRPLGAPCSTVWNCCSGLCILGYCRQLLPRF